MVNSWTCPLGRRPRVQGVCGQGSGAFGTLYLGNGKFIALILRMAGQTRRLQSGSGWEGGGDCQTTKALHVCVGDCPEDGPPSAPPWH